MSRSTVAPMRSRAPLAIALALTVATLVACGSSGLKTSATSASASATKASSAAGGGSSSTSAAASGGSSSSAAKSDTSKAGGSGDKSNYPDLCKVLTKDDITAAFKAPAGDPQPGSDNDKSCTFPYGDASGSSQAYVTYNGDWVDSTGMAKAGFDIVPVDGVGTDAWFGVGQFHMRWGTEDVVILAGGIVGNPDAKPGAVALGKILFGKLPKA
jgi:hypothetical protein